MGLKTIPKGKLVEGRWYLGQGRGSNVALWDGKTFRFFSKKFNQWVEKRCDHWDDPGMFSCFRPIEEIRLK